MTSLYKYAIMLYKTKYYFTLYLPGIEANHMHVCIPIVMYISQQNTWDASSYFSVKITEMYVISTWKMRFV